MVIHQFNKIIRNKWIWGVFAVAISIFFAFDFLFTGGRDESEKASAGTLNGEEVSAKKFSDFANDVRGFGRGRKSELSNAKVNQTAWENLAAYEVAIKLGLGTTDAEVREAIAQERSFQGEDGRFNLKIYEYLLRENGLTPEMYEAIEKRRMTLMKLRMVLSDSTRLVSPMELESAVNDFTDKLTVKIATFVDKSAAAPKLDDKALKAYYDENTNSIALPDCVKVRYISYKADAPERLKQFKITEDEMHDHYDATMNRFETQTTNGVVTKKFEEVKGILERELQLIASLEAYRTNLLFRAYPADGAKTMAKGTSRLDVIAKEDKTQVKTSPRFALESRKFVRGFMSRTSSFAPGVDGFAQAVAELDPESEDLRYGVVAGTNTVYLIERAAFEKAHVPGFEEAKNIIRGDAQDDAKAKAFKAEVEKARALAAAELAKGKAFDAKLFAGANVSTSITFSVSGMQRNAFADSMYAAAPAMKLSKGQISDFVSTALPGHAILVYLEDRKPGDAADAQMIRGQLRDELSMATSGSIAEDWNKWNLKRMNLKAESMASTEESTDDDGEVSEN